MTAGPESERTSGARQPPKHLVVGRIVRPHGLRGELIVDLSADLLSLLHEGTGIYLGEETRPRRLVRLRPHGRLYRASVRGVSTRTGAEAYRDQPIRVSLQAMAPLPPNVYYHWQILGLDVETDTGQKLGRIAEILQTGANDVYVVVCEAGEELLIPAIEDVIRSIDLPRARMIVHLLPGLRDEP